MAKTRLTFAFESTVGANATSGSKAGWTETWYNPADQSPEGARFSGLALLNARVKLLTPGWTISEMRLSQLDASNNLTRRGQLVFIAPANGVGSYPGTGQDEQPYDALEVRVDTFPGNFRAFSMRGIAKEVVNAGARFLNPPAFGPRFADWTSVLNGTAGDFGGGEWALRVRNKAATYNVRRVIIDPGVNPDASPSHPVVTLNGNVAIAAGQTVVLSGIAGNTRINGNWIVQAAVGPVGAADPYIVLKAKRRTSVGGVYTTGGTAVFYTYTLASITDAHPGYGVSRRTGRPPALVRGRRSNRA